ncbi:hypothetical protein AYM40_09760 [Paraburkholderia phytofirmans OLGA172]|uniref:Uncharacterized protein n=2 Tax=Paraburkholderia phytofirmans TaxID=261302 RepID=A0A160FJV8_9BURK|nr:hypothetical protein AYM40_09760 [Paraburkholderia phytofirmans OLGA172]
MSAPAKALREFWIEVRDRTRVDVGQPDLPPEVATAAGELAATLWRLSTDAANRGLDVFRQDAERDIELAREEACRADSARAAALLAIDEAAAITATDRQRIAGLEERLVEQQTANAMLREQLTTARSESSAAATALADARRDFAGELEKLRHALTQNEQRLAAAERRALLEIESERAAATRARKDFQAANERLLEIDAAHRAERDSLRDSLASLKTELAATVRDSASVQEQLATKEALLTNQISATESLRQRLETLSKRLETGRSATPRSALRPQVVPVRRARRHVDLSKLPFPKRNASGQ